MYHEVFIYVEDIIGSTWISDVPALKFCKRNFRTPAWVNNVISLHGSWLGQVPGMFPLREFLSPRVFYPQVVDQTSSWPTSLEFFPPHMQ
jgi:hypothetical protein